jgi:hypothetical protein
VIVPPPASAGELDSLVSDSVVGGAAVGAAVFFAQAPVTRTKADKATSSLKENDFIKDLPLIRVRILSRPSARAKSEPQ